MIKMNCLLLVFVPLVLSCQTKEANLAVEPLKQSQTTEESEEENQLSFDDIHPYGGWYCPDNLGMFPPVNLSEYKDVAIVRGRLPEYEETRNGLSLMYFDKEKIPNARPLEMDLPRIAKYDLNHTGKNELVIVIQAVAVDKDTVVGFRYLNGGNGSSWFREVDFLNDDEISEMGRQDFVFEVIEINAGTQKIWNTLRDSLHFERMTRALANPAKVKSNWKRGGEYRYVDEKGEILREGNITALWNQLYLQVDFQIGGKPYAEKLFMMEDDEGGKSTVKLVAGPFGDDMEKEQLGWKRYLQLLKERSEAQYFTH